MSFTVVVGNNVFHDCGEPLRVGEVTVLKVYERGGVVMFDLETHDQDGTLVAKTVGDEVMFAHPDYVVEKDPALTLVRTASGEPLMEVRATAPRTLRLLGTVWDDGQRWDMTEAGVKSESGSSWSGNVLHGFARGVTIAGGSIRMGGTGTPP